MPRGQTKHSGETAIPTVGEKSKGKEISRKVVQGDLVAMIPKQSERRVSKRAVKPK